MNKSISLSELLVSNLERLGYIVPEESIYYIDSIVISEDGDPQESQCATIAAILDIPVDDMVKYVKAAYMSSPIYDDPKAITQIYESKSKKKRRKRKSPFGTMKTGNGTYFPGNYGRKSDTLGYIRFYPGLLFNPESGTPSFPGDSGGSGDSGGMGASESLDDIGEFSDLSEIVDLIFDGKDTIKLYHATTKENKESIEKNGFDTTSKVYFQIGKSDYHGSKGYEELVVVEVDAATFASYSYVDHNYIGSDINEKLKKLGINTDNMYADTKDFIEAYVYNGMTWEGTMIYMYNGGDPIDGLNVVSE